MNWCCRGSDELLTSCTNLTRQDGCLVKIALTLKNMAASLKSVCHLCGRCPNQDQSRSHQLDQRRGHSRLVPLQLLLRGKQNLALAGSRIDPHPPPKVTDPCRGMRGCRIQAGSPCSSFQCTATFPEPPPATHLADQPLPPSPIFRPPSPLPPPNEPPPRMAAKANELGASSAMVHRIGETALAQNGASASETTISG